VLDSLLLSSKVWLLVALETRAKIWTLPSGTRTNRTSKCYLKPHHVFQ